MLGTHHSACVADDHTVFAWGAGSSGRLGLGDELNIAVPTMIESLQGLGIEGVRCFAEHTVALTVPLESHDAGVFDPHSQSRLERRVKELEVEPRTRRMPMASS